MALSILAVWPALAEGGRYDLVPEQDLRQTTSSNRVASAYVIHKKANQFWICTVRYHYLDLTANNGDCVRLPTESTDLRSARPMMSARSQAPPVSAPIFRYSGSSNPP